MTSSRRLAYLALIGNTILWGAAIPIVKRGFVDGLTPQVFLLGRFFFAAFFSIPIIIFHKRTRAFINSFKSKNLLKIILLEFVGALSLLILYQGVAETSAVESSLILATLPIFMTIGGIILLKEREEKHEVLGLVIALTGTLLLISGPLLEGNTNGNLTGNLLVFLYVIVVTVYYLVAKKIYKSLSIWVAVHIGFWVTLLLLMGITIANGQVFSQLPQLFSVSFWPLTAILYMAIGGSILGLTLYLIGQDKIEVSEATVFNYLQLAIAIPLSIFLLNESIKFIEIIAIIIIASGVYLVEKRSHLR